MHKTIRNIIKIVFLFFLFCRLASPRLYLRSKRKSIELQNVTLPPICTTEIRQRDTIAGDSISLAFFFCVCFEKKRVYFEHTSRCDVLSRQSGRKLFPAENTMHRRRAVSSIFISDFPAHRKTYRYTVVSRIPRPHLR